MCVWSGGGTRQGTGDQSCLVQKCRCPGSASFHTWASSVPEAIVRAGDPDPGFQGPLATRGRSAAWKEGPSMGQHPLRLEELILAQ